MASSTSCSVAASRVAATSRTRATEMAWIGGWQIPLVAAPGGAWSAVPQVLGPGS